MPKPILLVEDNLNDQALARIALARAGLLKEAHVVGDGVQALDYLFRRGNYVARPTTNPALVILDINMPKLNGIEVLRQVRANPITSEIPVVMLSGSGEEQDRVQSYEAGANGFVVKPLEFSEFVIAVADLGTFWALHNLPPGNSNQYRPRRKPA